LVTNVDVPAAKVTVLELAREMSDAPFHHSMEHSTPTDAADDFT
jgi:hypothetical protein